MPLDEKIRDSTLQPFDNELKEIKIGSTYEGGLKLDEVSNSVGVGFDHLGVYQAQVTPLCDTNANEILKDHRYSEGEKGKIVNKR